ncbi:hypothetical protein ACO0LF_15195, partial [Undibacterium sp. Di27W]|uniref:hypothetical protein n=1 Tax=Undibacterium sp. Di27W TaxID=3413036 RepID=UPI003BF2EE72
PNRTVKRLRANDSAATSVKVGYRQAFILQTPAHLIEWGFCFWKNGKYKLKTRSKSRSRPLNTEAPRHRVALRKTRKTKEQQKHEISLFLLCGFGFLF